MKTFYVIRSGWNSANQSSMGRPVSPKNKFESNLYNLVAIVKAESGEQAIASFGGSCYANQTLFAVSNPRSIVGLTAAIASF